MDDKELLELAAKANGFEDYLCFDGDVLVNLSDKSGRLWNPLEDDGAAFRLAVMLCLDILRTEFDVEAIAALPPHVKLYSDYAPFGIQEIGDDPYAATRRAIVRAAAEIGKRGA